MRITMVIEAMEMARRPRGARREGFVAQPDASNQVTSTRYGERVAEIGAVGSIGDAFGIALAETVSGLERTS